MHRDDSDSDLQQRNQVTGPGQARPPGPLTLSTDTDQSWLTIRPFNPELRPESVSVSVISLLDDTRPINYGLGTLGLSQVSDTDSTSDRKISRPYLLEISIFPSIFQQVEIKISKRLVI